MTGKGRGSFEAYLQRVVTERILAAAAAAATSNAIDVFGFIAIMAVRQNAMFIFGFIHESA